MHTHIFFKYDLTQRSSTLSGQDCRDVIVLLTINSPAVEVPAAETTVEFSEFDTHTQVQATTIVIEYGAVSNGAGGAATITMSVNGSPEGGAGQDGKITITPGTPYTTSWTFDATTLSLSFTSRQESLCLYRRSNNHCHYPNRAHPCDCRRYRDSR